MRRILLGILIVLLLLMVSEVPAKTWIEVHFHESVPHLYLFEDGKEVASYPVAVARPDIKFHLPVDGQIVKIELCAAWHPTPLSRQVYAQQHHASLPAEVPCGDSRNMMGAGKMTLVFPPGFSPKPLRIHGTTVPESIGKHVTGGCVRMYNQDYEDLVKRLEKIKLPITVHYQN